METRNCDFNEIFVMCYERYFHSVLNYIRGFVFNEFISEEIAQEVFLKDFEKADRAEVEVLPSKLKNFVFKIARNKSFDFLKREKIEYSKLMEVHFEEARLDNDFYYNLENCYIEGEVISTMNETINSFPEDKKGIFIDMVVHKKNLKNISKEHNVSIYKVKKIRKEISRKIRENVSPIIEIED